ncbi:hypothetical protein [Pedobacter aquatilis]|uniref:acyltransferase n=1 Tax=Pedobacter aquatilis TaxID=351343 RepID=UPI0029308384|nr:hypothetical protein [Pedobacter aquatilis]
MLKAIKNKVKQHRNLKFFLKSPINFFYSVILTLFYVDKYSCFPAFEINGNVNFKLLKKKGAYLQINGRLTLEQWLYGKEQILLSLNENSNIIIENDFTIGNGVRIFVDKNAKLIIKGKQSETASGITANSIIMVRKFIEIGYDCIIAWDTFITDCDWHGIEGKAHIATTIVGDHVWVGVGVKVLKGVIIGSNSVVTTLSVLVGKKFPSQAMISGNPANVLKVGIPNWNREMNS